MKIHPYAELFPAMSDKEFSDLVEDIRANDQQFPIVKIGDEILDGVNRFRACMVLNKAPITTQYAGKDPLAYVISVNMIRRHLTSDQRAMLAVKLLATREERTAAKAAAGGPPGSKAPMASTTGLSIKVAAGKMKVSDKKVSLAEKVADKAHEIGRPEVVRQVETGKINLHAAANKVGLPLVTKVAPAPLGRHSHLHLAASRMTSYLKVYVEKIGELGNLADEDREEILGFVDRTSLRLEGIREMVGGSADWDAFLTSLSEEGGE